MTLFLPVVCAQQQQQAITVAGGNKVVKLTQEYFFYNSMAFEITNFHEDVHDGRRRMR
jgi:hypothetical protein